MDADRSVNFFAHEYVKETIYSASLFPLCKSHAMKYDITKPSLLRIMFLYYQSVNADMFCK